MTNAQLKKLVNEAVALHRNIVAQSERLKIMKADLVREARLHENDFTPTNNGGSRWTATGTDGCIARVNFPTPALTPLIIQRATLLTKYWRLPGNAWIVCSSRFTTCGLSPNSAKKSHKRCRNAMHAS